MNQVRLPRTVLNAGKGKASEKVNRINKGDDVLFKGLN